MPEIQTIRRNLALKEYEIRETPSGKTIFFSIKFVKKNGELVFIPRAVSTGLRFTMKEHRMRGVLPVDEKGNAAGHVTPFHIDGMVEWNGKRVKI
jgi:hypothetical protein